MGDRKMVNRVHGVAESDTTEQRKWISVSEMGALGGL